MASSSSNARSGDTAEQNRGVPLAKAAWLTTVIACVIAVVVLAATGYLGYAATAGCVALAAAINLR